MVPTRDACAALIHNRAYVSRQTGQIVVREVVSGYGTDYYNAICHLRLGGNSRYTTIRRSILPNILDEPGDEYVIPAQGYFRVFTDAIVQESQKYLPRSAGDYTIRAIAGGMILGSSGGTFYQHSSGRLPNFV